MNMKSALKLIPPRILNKLIQKHLLPGFVGIMHMARHGHEPLPGESEIQVLLIQRDGKLGEPPANTAVVVALDEDLQITRHIERHDLAALIQKIDAEKITHND